MKKITILPLGFLGLKTYQKFLMNKIEVSGSYINTPKNVKNEFQFDFNLPHKDEYIENSDIIIVNIPPSKLSNKDTFLEFIKMVNHKHLVFISSTSVYGMQGDVDENTIPMPESKNGKFLLELEDIIQNQCSQFKIIRSAGQYGYSRHPGKSLSGKKNIKQGHNFVNLISINDLISLIELVILEKDNLIINAVNINHPIKSEFYTDYCSKNNLPPPQFTNEKQKRFKMVNTTYKRFEVHSKLIS